MAAAKLAPRRTHTGDFESDDMQRPAQDVARRFNACPFFTGVRVTGIDFAAGVDRIVDHGLGRRAAGFFVIRDYGANVCTGVGEATAQLTDTSKQIRLRSPVTCRVDLWIFG